MEELSLRLGRAERRMRSRTEPIGDAGHASQEASRAGVSDRDTYVGLDYFLLESRYRPPGVIEERMASYLPCFAGCRNVLDIGCGRGEFVEAAISNGILAHGIDLDADAVAYARERGLPVQQADALTYLGALAEAALDGIFMAQLVEHLTPADLISLLQLCQRKMKPDAVLVAETINPVCLWAVANWYLIDPTHVRPVHPGTLTFALESTGFWRTEIRYLSPVPDDAKLRELPLDEHTGSELRGVVEGINGNVRRLNEFLYGFQEYAAISRRAPDDAFEAAKADAPTGVRGELA